MGAEVFQFGPLGPQRVGVHNHGPFQKNLSRLGRPHQTKFSPSFIVIITKLQCSLETKTPLPLHLNIMLKRKSYSPPKQSLIFMRQPVDNNNKCILAMISVGKKSSFKFSNANFSPPNGPNWKMDVPIKQRIS